MLMLSASDFLRGEILPLQVGIAGSKDGNILKTFETCHHIPLQNGHATSRHQVSERQIGAISI